MRRLPIELIVDKILDRLDAWQLTKKTCFPVLYYDLDACRPTLCGNRKYHTSPALCTLTTSFPADWPHRLDSKFSGFLYLCFPGINNNPFCCTTLLAIELIHFAANALQCIVNGEETLKIVPSPWDFVTLPEEDRATAIVNMHRNIGKDRACGSEAVSYTHLTLPTIYSV